MVGGQEPALDQALPQTSPQSQGHIVVPGMKLLVPRVCHESIA